MPKQKPTDISHTVTTDHWIRRRPAARTSALSATFLPGELIPLEDFFHAAEPGEQGIAHATFGVRSSSPANLAKGLELLKHAVEQQPNKLRWKYWLGYALRHQGKLKEAAEILRQSLQRIELRHNSPLAEDELLSLYSELTQLYFQIGQTNQALEVNRLLREIAPDYTPAYELGADISVATGHHQDAFEIARAGVQKNPMLARLQWIVGWKQFEIEQNPDAAIASLKRAIELEPTELAPYLVLAQAYNSLGQVDRAVESLHSVLAIDSEFLPALITLADLHIQNGRHDEAVPLLEKVLYKYPGNSQARELLKRAKNEQ